MSHAKQVSKRKRRTKAVTALGGERRRRERGAVFE